MVEQQKLDTVELSEFKGHPILSIPANGYAFSFGVVKAKAILEYLDDIKKFVMENDN